MRCQREKFYRWWKALLPKRIELAALPGTAPINHLHIRRSILKKLLERHKEMKISRDLAAL